MSWKYFKRGSVSDDKIFDIIKSPLITEKSTMLSEFDQVGFKVASDASKHDIKIAIEKLFSVEVTAVNTVCVKGKTKRFRGRIGQRSDYKKAIVTLKSGQSIDVSAGL